MKYTLLIALSLGLSACSLFTPKRVVEVVPSCFSDGEDQTKICKAQRVNEDSRIIITRCIGMRNREANPGLRGKCVEKICTEGSNTDCSVKGDVRVLEQYAELVTSNMFADGDSAPTPKKHVVKEKKLNSKAAKASANATQVPAAAPATVASVGEVDTDPSAVLPPMPEKKVAVEVAAAPAPKFTKEEAAAPAMSIALKPAKSVKKKIAAASSTARAIASVKGDEGFKKVCVAKSDSSAPESLRGKCATRNCSSGKCSYKGRKEMFDYVARGEAG